MKDRGCYHVVGYYPGDIPARKGRVPRGKRVRGFVYGTMGRRQATSLAASLQKKAGGQAANVIYEAVQCDRAKRMFDLKV